MNYIDCLYDDYENHKRRTSNQDELDVLVSKIAVSKSTEKKDILDYVGDALISAGTSIKKYHGDHPSTRLTHVRGDA